MDYEDVYKKVRSGEMLLSEFTNAQETFRRNAWGDGYSAGDADGGHLSRMLLSLVEEGK